MSGAHHARMKGFAGINKKNVIFDTTNGLQNGVVFAATYEDASLSAASEQGVKNSSKSGQGLTQNKIQIALAKVIDNYAELRTTVNSDMQFELLDCVPYDDVVLNVQLECFNDKHLDCHGGIPPYILRQILSNNTWSTGKPLWKLLLVRDKMLIFHGHDALFDSYTAANFHKLFLNALNSSEESPSKVSKFISQYGAKLTHLQKSCFNRQPAPVCSPELCSCYDGTSSAAEGCNSFFRAKPSFSLEHEQYDRVMMPSAALYNNARPVPLCGKVVFGIVDTTRLSVLQSYVKDSATTLQMFLAAATIFSLENANFKHLANLSFAIPMCPRNSKVKASEGGFSPNNVFLNFPFSDNNDESLKISDHKLEDLDGATLKDQAFANEQSDKGLRFEALLSAVSKKMKDAKRVLDNTRNEDLNHRKSTKTPVVEIIDLTSHTFPKSEKDQYFIQDAYAARSRKTDVFMSIHFCLASSGLTVSIHYPEESSMDVFVEHFESLMELYPEIV
ncbi:LAFA_0B07910g1_1 [Lachancea sp. 'fantastica']|nr:LAFA_0B07910g1_1 [Lachancea sp. 'fantastica']